MAAATLVEFPRDGGRNLLKKLDDMGIEVTAAFWQFQDDAEQWRLVLATPEVDDKGPLHVIREIRAALDALSEEEKEGLMVSHTGVYGSQQMKIRDALARHGKVEHETEVYDRWRIHSRSEPYIYRLLPAQ